MNDATESEVPAAAMRNSLWRKLFAVHPVVAPERSGFARRSRSGR